MISDNGAPGLPPPGPGAPRSRGRRQPAPASSRPGGTGEHPQSMLPPGRAPPGFPWPRRSEVARRCPMRSTAARCSGCPRSPARAPSRSRCCARPGGRGDGQRECLNGACGPDLAARPTRPPTGSSLGPARPRFPSRFFPVTSVRRGRGRRDRLHRARSRPRSPPATGGGGGHVVVPAGHVLHRRHSPAQQRGPAPGSGLDDPVQPGPERLPAGGVHPVAGHRADELLAVHLLLRAAQHRGDRRRAR